MYQIHPTHNKEVGNREVKVEDIDNDMTYDKVIRIQDYQYDEGIQEH